MALKIYGIPRSRAFRILWMAKELGLDYENIPIDMGKGETRTPDYLKINPNGHIPAIDDDGVVLWESMAINLYLAKKYSPNALYPARLEDEARAWQWSFWGMTEVERPVLTAMFNRALLPEDKRDAAAADEAERQLQQPLKVLDGAVSKPPPRARRCAREPRLSRKARSVVGRQHRGRAPRRVPLCESATSVYRAGKYRPRSTQPPSPH